MPKITSNLEHTKAFIPADAGWYSAKVIKCELDGKAKMPAITIDFQVLDTHPKYPGRKIMFQGFIAGGNNPKTKEPYSLNSELNYIDSLQIPYECLKCNAEQSEGPVRDKIDYRCPTCKEVLSEVAFNTEDFVGKICDIELTLDNQKKYEDDGSGNQRLVDSLDGEGMPIKRNSVKRTRKFQEDTNSAQAA